MSYKAGFVGVLGLPNAGKSTLVNALVGEKVGIVSKKPQTTRQRVLGIMNDDGFQAVMVDAPGLVKTKEGLNSYLESEFNTTIKDSDLIIAVLNLDAADKESLLEIINCAKVSNKPWLAVITKIDLNYPERRMLLKQILENEKVPYLEVCALDDIAEFKKNLLKIMMTHLPESSGPLYDPELYTSQTEREMASEIIREKCFEYLHQEVPYGLAVRILNFKEEENITKIEAEIIVKKSNHVSMVVGQGGQTIKRIGASARIEIEKLLDKKVFLKTHVKMRSNWIEDSRILKELGYAARA